MLWKWILICFNSFHYLRIVRELIRRLFFLQFSLYHRIKPQTQTSCTNETFEIVLHLDAFSIRTETMEQNVFSHFFYGCWCTIENVAILFLCNISAHFCGNMFQVFLEFGIRTRSWTFLWKNLRNYRSFNVFWFRVETISRAMLCSAVYGFLALSPLPLKIWLIWVGLGFSIVVIWLWQRLNQKLVCRWVFRMFRCEWEN